MAWATTSNLMDDIHETLTQLDVDGDDKLAHTKCRLFNAAIKVMAVELEHARLTQRLRDDSLPAIVLNGRGGGAVKKLPASPSAKRKKSAA